jgi:hypothetical protein
MSLNQGQPVCLPCSPRPGPLRPRRPWPRSRPGPRSQPLAHVWRRVSLRLAAACARLPLPTAMPCCWLISSFHHPLPNVPAPASPTSPHLGPSGATPNPHAHPFPRSLRPECKLFVGYSRCCQGTGILAAGAAIKAWLVCNRDVYLPDAKCLTGGRGVCGVCVVQRDGARLKMHRQQGGGQLSMPSSFTPKQAVAAPGLHPPAPNPPGPSSPVFQALLQTSRNPTFPAHHPCRCVSCLPCCRRSHPERQRRAAACHRPPAAQPPQHCVGHRAGHSKRACRG